MKGAITPTRGVAEFYDRVYHRNVQAAGRPGRQLVDTEFDLQPRGSIHNGKGPYSAEAPYEPCF